MIKQNYPLKNLKNGRALKNASVIYVGEVSYLKSNDRIIAKRFNGKVIIGSDFDMYKHTMKHLSIFLGLPDLPLEHFYELVNIGYINLSFTDLQKELT